MRYNAIFILCIIGCLVIPIGTRSNLPDSQLTVESDTSSPSLPVPSNRSNLLVDEDHNNTSVRTEFAPISLPIDSTAVKNGTSHIGLGNNHRFEALPESNTIDISYSNSFNDTFAYSSNFSKLWDTGTGSLNTSHSTNQNETYIGIENGIYNNIYSVNTDISVKPGSFLNVSLSNLDFTLDDSQFGYYNLVFDFDTIKVTLVYNATADYENYMTNSSDEIVLINEGLGDTFVNISQLTSMVGGNDPNQLINLYATSYVDDLYNLSSTFDQIMLFVPHELSSLHQQLEAGQDYEIKMLPTIKTDLFWKRTVDNIDPMEFTLNDSNNTLHASTKINHFDGYFQYTYYYSLNPYAASFHIRSDQIIHSNQTTFWYVWQSNCNLTIDIELIREDNDVTHPTPIQGRLLNFSISSSTWTTVYLHHTKLDQLTIQQDQSNSTIQIPSTWSKGNLTGYALTISGHFISWNTTLKLSPSTLISASSFTFTITQKKVIPIIISNITSGQEFRPDRILSRVNGSIWSIDDQHGIIIPIGAFQPGITSLHINATYRGLVPIVTTLRLKIEPATISPEISTKRLATNMSQLVIKVPELANWTVGAVLNVTGAGINENYTIATTYNQITLVQPEWQASESYELKLRFIVDHDLAHFNFSTTVTALSTGDDQSDSTSPGLWFTLVSIMGISGTVAFKVYQTKFSSDTINF